jgi:DNA primase
MARVPQEELERLKAEVSLQRLVEAKGVELRKHGAHDLVGRCPFHDDREPSLVVSPSKNLWHCMGACQAGGSVVDWVMRAEKVSFRHAVELLRTDPSFAARGTVRLAKHPDVRVLPPPVTPDADDRELLRQVVGYYHETLLEAPEARGYLAGRGLDDRELLTTFRLGFANRTLGLRLPVKTRRAGEEIRTRLQALGILRESGHEHFNGSVVVPVCDEDGHIAEMYGRKVTPRLRPGTPEHLYLPGPHRGVWNAAGLGAEVILCEALLDALSLWVAGFRHVTASYGVEGFTDDHLAAFQRHGVERVLIAYDHDQAGDRAAVLLATKLVAAGMDVYRVQFPHETDANAFLCDDVATAPERFARLLSKAVWLGSATRAKSLAVPGVSPSPPPLPDATADAGSAAAKEEAAPDPSFAADPPRALATPAPPVPHTDPLAAVVSEDELAVSLGERRWRARGLTRLVDSDALKVNLLVSDASGERFFVDVVDLYSARQRQAFTKQAAGELGVVEEMVKRDLGKLLLRLELLVAERREREKEQAAQEAALSEAERESALALLRDPQLLDRIVDDYERVGVVGEATNKLVAYLAATSRLLERPLAVVVQSTSAAGKSALLEATLALLPDNARVKYSAMTGQSLYYMAENGLSHKVLAVVEEEGAERAAYALKLLQSEGELRIASTGKDAQTGRLVTHEYHVTGPVALFLTTTSTDVDEELLNRCLVLSVDEDREQTRAIHQQQREGETLHGLVRDRERQRVMARHRAAQGLLRPLVVVNPYADRLDFASERTRMRRDHLKYLALIRTVALLHQYQRPVQRVVVDGEEVEYIETTLDDIAVANRLAHEVLGRSLDELPPQTRRLLVLLDSLVSRVADEQELGRGAVRFTRRELRAETGWGDTQLKCHLARLVELEYLAVHRIQPERGRAGGFAYELLWDGGGDDGAARLSGLVDPESLRDDGSAQSGSEAAWSGPESAWSGSGRPVVGPWPGPGRDAANGGMPLQGKEIPLSFAASADNRGAGDDDEDVSYPQAAQA